jgi:hypothetical protein
MQFVCDDRSANADSVYLLVKNLSLVFMFLCQAFRPDFGLSRRSLGEGGSFFAKAELRRSRLFVKSSPSLREI